MSVITNLTVEISHPNPNSEPDPDPTWEAMGSLHHDVRKACNLPASPDGGTTQRGRAPSIGHLGVGVSPTGAPQGLAHLGGLRPLTSRGPGGRGEEGAV